MSEIARKKSRFFALLFCMVLCSFFYAVSQAIPFSPTEISSFLPTSPFQATAHYDARHRIIIRFTVPPGYYLYRNKITVEAPSPLRLKTVHFPYSAIKYATQQGNSIVYEDNFFIVCTLQGAQHTPFTLRVHAQGCAKTGICYPPQTYQFSNLSSTFPQHVITAQLINTVPPTPLQTLDTQKDVPSNLSTYVAHLQQHSWPLFILGFFGIGVLLSLTPCVFPIIPIIISCILNSRQPLSWKKTAQLSCGYVVSMALTYSIVGAVAGATGTLLSVWLQTPLALIGFAAIMVLLSCAMFDLLTFQAPLAIQNAAHLLSQRYRNGQFWNVCVMGALSALIVGPCVAAPLAGVLLYVSQTGNILLGWSALLLMGLGMGFPLLVIANFTGKLVPQSGNALNVVKHILGILLLGLALRTIQPLISPTLLLWGYGVLAIGASVVLATFEPLQAGAPMSTRASKCVGLVFLLMGSTTIFVITHHTLWHSLRAQHHIFQQQEALPVQSAYNLPQLRSLIAHSKKSCLVEFYASWCTTCHDFENETLSHPDVIKALKNWQWIRVDISHYDAITRELLHHFSLFGPPALLFFAHNQPNKEIHRHIGFISSDHLVQILSTFT